MIVIGHGFIAKNIRNIRLKVKNNYIIYASGISNSKIKDKKEIDRERKKLIDLIKKLNKKDILIYISSLSVLNKSLKKDKYVQNKIFIEKKIKLNVKNYIIIRLPQIVGINTNPYTITNFFYNNIKNNKKFDLWPNVQRNLIDIEDFKYILKDILNKKYFTKKILNIFNPESISAKEIINIFEKILKKKSKFNEIGKINEKKFNYNNLKKHEYFNLFKKKDYNYKILKKYYK